MVSNMLSNDRMKVPFPVPSFRAPSSRVLSVVVDAAVAASVSVVAVAVGAVGSCSVRYSNCLLTTRTHTGQLLLPW